MVDRWKWGHWRTRLRDIFLPARYRRDESFHFEPLASLSIVKRLLAIHVDVQHPVVPAEVVLVGDAESCCRYVGLILSLSQTCRPVQRSSSSETTGRLRLAKFAAVP